MDLDTFRLFLFRHGAVSSRGHARWVPLAQQMLRSGTLRLVSSSWHDPWRQDHLNIYGSPDLDKVSAYEDCVVVRFSGDASQVWLEMSFWEGDMLDGQPTEPRCAFRFEVLALAPAMEEAIARRLRRLAEQAVQEAEREAYESKIDAASDALLVSLRAPQRTEEPSPVDG